MTKVLALCALLAGPASAVGTAASEPSPSVVPTFTITVFDEHPRADSQLTTNGRSLAVGAEFSLEFQGRYLLTIAGLWTTGDFPSAILFDVKVGYLFLRGPVSPYVSVGIGALSQQGTFEFDGGTSAAGSGAAVILEAGLHLMRWPLHGRLALCGQLVLPLFSVKYVDFPGFPQATIPFLLLGVKLGY